MNVEPEILRIIYDVMDEVNSRLPAERQLQKSGETPLFGGQGKLDSMGLVHFIVAVEDRVRDDFGLAITVADDRAISRESSPFRSVASLSRYIAQLIATEG